MTPHKELSEKIEERILYNQLRILSGELEKHDKKLRENFIGQLRNCSEALDTSDGNEQLEQLMERVKKLGDEVERVVKAGPEKKAVSWVRGLFKKGKNSGKGKEVLKEPEEKLKDMEVVAKIKKEEVNEAEEAAIPSFVVTPPSVKSWRASLPDKSVERQRGVREAPLEPVVSAGEATMPKEDIARKNVH
ncbi:hypothetical protein RUND412_001975 [Rhizina undulata]